MHANNLFIFMTFLQIRTHNSFYLKKTKTLDIYYLFFLHIKKIQGNVM